MDDDAPLSALAKPLKLDDDTPLASLADLGKAKPSPKPPKVAGSPAAKGPPKGSPKAAAGKAGAKATPKKRAQSSSSSSSSDSSSGSESDEKPKAPRRKASNSSLGKKAKLRYLDAQNEEGAEDGGGAVKKRERSIKEQVVADVLCRWWYVFPDWPPREEAYYQAELAKKNLRKVAIAEWEWVPEVDKQGNHKVYEMTQFPGLFRNSNGDLVDLRPKDTCPCYQNFMKKELHELYELLVKAMENQIEDLKNSKYNETQMEQELKVKLTAVREKLYGAKQFASVKRKKSLT